MNSLSKLTPPRLRKKIYSQSFRVYKELYQHVKGEGWQSKKVVFIFGCQRSGTTLMTEIFEKDLNVKVYPERSRLCTHAPNDEYRLNPLSIVKETIDRDRFPVVVLKPLVEVQNSVRILSYFPGAKAIWMYRNHKDVASSNLKRFGIRNGIDNLRFIVRNDYQNWRAEHVPDYLREIVVENFSETMNPHDAAALFWFVRNSFFFDLKLDKHPDIIMCRYGDLVTNPFQAISTIYDFIDQPFPNEKLTANVHPLSVGKGKTISLSTKIDRLCADLLVRLENCYHAQTNSNL